MTAQHAALAKARDADTLAQELAAAEALIVEAKAQLKALPSGKKLVRPALARLEQRTDVSRRAAHAGKCAGVGRDGVKDFGRSSEL